MKHHVATRALATRVFAALLIVGLLVACGGIPLRSLPRLMRFQEDLLKADPAELMLAIQMDARMTPPAGAVPQFHLVIRPAEAGAFDAIDRKFPMRVTGEPPSAFGLTPAPAGRHWLIYGFPAASQADLARIQAKFKAIQEQSRKRGGTVSIGIEQSGMAVRDSAFASTRWESWLQTSRQDGFFELWSGSIADLLAREKSGEADTAPRTN